MPKTLLKNRRVRSAVLQSIFVGALLLSLGVVVWTTRANLAAQGLTSGFAFLDQSTGWNINFSLFPYTPDDHYSRALLVGFANTVFLAAIALPLATLIGLLVAILRTSQQRIMEAIGTTYVETFRNVPLLLQLFFWYAILTGLPAPRNALNFADSIFLSGRGLFMPWISSSSSTVLLAAAVVLIAAALDFAIKLSAPGRRLGEPTKRIIRAGIWVTALIGVAVLLWTSRIEGQPFLSYPQLQGLRFRGGISISLELLACIVAISLYGGAYIAEVLRAGFNAVPRGQVEASLALGLRPWQIFSRIRLPLAIRACLPMLTNQYVALTKATTLGIAVGYADFYMVVSTSINQSGHTLELIAILAGGFLAINFTLATVLNRVNDAVKLKGSQLRA
ncbi:ABC transporter permease subunit [Bosea sp. LjRoot9]|uniref:amino acid ABC transporter permease n=1 Tax=Bosea sp. LjRoot9 TaxID=3342341 RepID=UPI003ED0C902